MRAIRFLALLALAGALLPAPAVARPGPPAATAAQPKASADAKIVDFAFEPAKLTVDLGTTVTWTNRGARPHTATDRGGTFDTRPISPNETGSVVFSAPGVYSYFCRVNPSKMNGVVVVKQGATPARAQRVQALDPGFAGNAFKFDPATLTVPTGSTIVFANVGGKPHTLTADDKSFDTGVVDPGAEGGRFAGHNTSITLTKPGTFRFHCEVHAQRMKGVFTVVGAEVQGPAVESAGPRQVRVGMGDFAFDPKEASAAPGAAVTFANRGEVAHTATFDDAPLDTNVVQPGASAKLTAPAKPGSYSYRCNVHPGRMRAVLVVLGPGVADPTRQAEAATVAAVPGGGPGGGVSAFGVSTAVAAAFLGGFGLSALALRGRRRTEEDS